MISASAGAHKKRKLPLKDPPPASATTGSEEGDVCSFCLQVPAAVSVDMPVMFRKKRASTPYCLTCYYTTSAVRQDPTEYARCLNQDQLDAQLPQMQQLFSEVYVELQKELREEAERAFSKQKSDPLALLRGGTGSAPRRMKAAVAPKPGLEKNKAGNSTDGGFLRQVPLPQRLLKTQQEQAKLQQSQIDRMNKAMKAAPPPATIPTAASQVYQKRKASRKSIWNLAMDPAKVAEAELVAESMSATDNHLDKVPACSCGSRNVKLFGNLTSRNQDLKKGETWGMKDRGDDVVSRYQCNSCGKMWNEAE